MASNQNDSANTANSNPSNEVHTGWVLFATILASSMAFIDGSALNVALPALQADLAASGKELLWIVNAYMLLLSSLLLTGGSLGDRYGRKKVFMLGIAVFALASTAAGLAPTSQTMIIARGFQGVGGALMVPGSLAIISACIPSGQRGRAIGTWSAFTTITTIAGPVLGGALAGAGLWRGIFFINLPLAALALAATALRVPETRDENNARLDWLGSVVVTVALAALTYGAIEAPERGLRQPIIIISLLLGFVGLAAFVLVERRVRQPMVPLNLFKNRTFTGANLLTLCLYAALNAIFFFFSLTLIQAQGYQAQEAGLASVPMVALLALLSRWAGGLVDRYGARGPLIIGPAVAGIGFFSLSFPGLTADASTYWTTYLPGVLLIGLGMGITVAPLTTVVMTSLPDSQVGVASGVNNAVARVAGVLAIAVVGGLALVSFRQLLVDQSNNLPINQQERQALIEQAPRLGEASPPPGFGLEAAEQADQVIRRSLLITFRRTTYASAGLAWLSALAAAIWIEPKQKTTKAKDEKTPAA